MNLNLFFRKPLERFIGKKLMLFTTFDDLLYVCIPIFFLYIADNNYLLAKHHLIYNYIK